MQGYKVYQDPEGTRSLDQTNNYTTEVNNRNAVTNDDDDYYKKRLLILNEEIKTLNDEIAKVCKYVIISAICIATKILSFIS